MKTDIKIWRKHVNRVQPTETEHSGRVFDIVMKFMIQRMAGEISWTAEQLLDYKDDTPTE